MARSDKGIRRPDGGATDQVGEGPRDINGAEASELPDQGRGDVDSDFGKQAARKLPGQIGGLGGDGDDVGLAGESEISDARRHGGRKHN
ncbi:MAG TPA: hypothetical protein VG326_14950 [Tepidisphaeraceae bacterium]|nr:hypothetical protein [Tepidisphaeraceae bacterium]